MLLSTGVLLSSLHCHASVLLNQSELLPFFLNASIQKTTLPGCCSFTIPQEKSQTPSRRSCSSAVVSLPAAHMLLHFPALILATTWCISLKSGFLSITADEFLELGNRKLQLHNPSSATGSVASGKFSVPLLQPAGVAGFAWWDGTRGSRSVGSCSGAVVP